MSRPPRLHLAHLPTPIQALPHLSEGLGRRRVLVKRDDLTGSHLSGNKIRKLEYLLADALAERATHVLTCGGVQSNHCRATALAAAPLGLKPVLLLRTPGGRRDDLPEPPTGNVLLDRLVGAELHTCDPAGYARRDDLLRALAERVRADGGRPYIVPEGGSNALGAWGYVQAAEEIAGQCEDELPAAVVCATGSGGTLAGLAMGFKRLGLPVRAVGVAVGDDEDTFRRIVRRISEDAAARWRLPALEDEDFLVLDGYQGRGYALSTPAELSLLADSARRYGLLLDPVYTGKAFGALLDQAAAGADWLGQRTLFLHTGGLFGLFPAAAELAEVLGPPRGGRAA